MSKHSMDVQFADWQAVHALWAGWQFYEAADRGYDAKAADEARSKFYLEKGKYEKKHGDLWNENEPVGQKVLYKKEVSVSPGPLGSTQYDITLTPIGHNNPPADTPEEEFRRRMAEEHEELIAEAEKLAKAKAKPCEDDAYAERLTNYIKRINTTMKALEKVKKDEKAPIQQRAAIIDTYFRNIVTALDTAKAKAQKPLNDFLNKKAAEEQRKRLEAAEQLRRESEAQEAAAAALRGAGRTDEAEKAEKAADKIERHADHLSAQAETKTAAVAQVRSSAGGSASLRTRIVGRIVDIKTLDLEALRPYIEVGALNKAIDRFIAVGGRELKGAVIEQTSEAVVR